MPHGEEILGLKGYEIKEIQSRGQQVNVWVRYTGPIRCPHCAGKELRLTDRFTRRLGYASVHLAFRSP